ncbi:hypothetical protein H0X09_01195 [Candidatus Saccharibacteria bacterium]|nr:hypothetical protein [Candidatus Saccharibacteria bacterium]
MRETLRKRLPTFHLGIEAHLRMDDPEVLENLKSTLEAAGYDFSKLLFSGYDGSLIKGKSVKEFPTEEAIYAMNEAGWREAITVGEWNPAQYAEDHVSDSMGVACLGVYDKDQLSEVYEQVNFDLTEDSYQDGLDVSQRSNIKVKKLGDELAAKPDDYLVREAVAHKDWPALTPSDALVAVVFLNHQEKYKQSRGL